MNGEQLKKSYSQILRSISVDIIDEILDTTAILANESKNTKLVSADDVAKHLPNIPYDTVGYSI